MGRLLLAFSNCFMSVGKHNVQIFSEITGTVKSMIGQYCYNILELLCELGLQSG